MKSRLIPILVTGFVLALGLLLAVQVTQSLRGGQAEVPETAEISPDAFNQTVNPVIFKSISEQDGELRISGTSEAGAVISIRNDGQNFRQIKANGKGEWSITLDIDSDPAMIIDLVVFVENGAKIRSDETLFRIPAPTTIDLADRTNPAALIMITAPGGPTRIVQSPFRGLPTVGPISMGPIEYDDSGSVIFSGTSEARGQVRIFANNVLVGERPVSASGRWFFIAIETLPLGSYPITAEILTIDGDVHRVSVPFQRLKHENEDERAGRALRVNYDPGIWQVSRNIYGGGRQYTAIFAPIVEPAKIESEEN